MHFKHIRNRNLKNTEDCIYTKHFSTCMYKSAYHWFVALYINFFSHSTCACAVWFISIFSTVKSGFMAVASWMAWARASS